MKKAVKTKKSKTQITSLTQRQQWSLVLLLVVFLLGFAFLVNGFDFMWNAHKSA